MEVTSRVRSYIYREFFERDEPVHHISAPSPVDGAVEMEQASRSNVPPLMETQAGNGPVSSTPQSSSSSVPQKVKVSRIAPALKDLFLVELASLLVVPISNF